MYFNDNPNKYIIIIYEDHCPFQRCGTPKEVNGEYNYESLDELYKAQQIDGIVLERDWECSVVSCAQGIAQITLAPGNRFIRDMLFNERNHTIWERSEKS